MACTQFQNLEFEISRKILKKIRVLTSDSIKIEELVESLQAMEMNMRQTTKKRRERLLS
jgi:glutamate racemase